MFPDRIVVGSITTTAYDALHVVAAVVSATLAALLNRRQGISLRVTAAVAVLGPVTTYASARLLDSIEYRRPLTSSDLLLPGPSSIYGGLIAAFVLIAVVSRIHSVSPLRFLDAAAPAFALAEATTRVGCYLAGCCYGIRWTGPLAVTFPPGSLVFSEQVARGLVSAAASHSLPVVPVQLLSVALAAVACAWLVLGFLRPHSPGTVFFRFLLFYGVLRLGMAPLREEALASMKVFSIAFITAGTLGLRCARGRHAVPAPEPV